MKTDVIVFSQYPFKVGEKIRIENSRRGGDWEVARVSDHKVTLRCPISAKEFEWTNFCYLVSEEKNSSWPKGE